MYSLFLGIYSYVYLKNIYTNDKIPNKDYCLCN